MGTVAAVDPASHVTQVFTDPLQLYDAMTKAGYIAVRRDGTAYTAQMFEGGMILDGAPFNVYFDGVWYPEQRELLLSHWGKDVPRPPDDILNLPLDTGPEAMAAIEGWQRWKAEQPMIAGIPNWALFAGAGVAAWFFFLRK